MKNTNNIEYDTFIHSPYHKLLYLMQLFGISTEELIPISPNSDKMRIYKERYKFIHHYNEKTSFKTLIYYYDRFVELLKNKTNFQHTNKNDVLIWIKNSKDILINEYHNKDDGNILSNGSDTPNSKCLFETFIYNIFSFGNFQVPQTLEVGFPNNTLFNNCIYLSLELSLPLVIVDIIYRFYFICNLDFSSLKNSLIDYLSSGCLVKIADLINNNDYKYASLFKKNLIIIYSLGYKNIEFMKLSCFVFRLTENDIDNIKIKIKNTTITPDFLLKNAKIYHKILDFEISFSKIKCGVEAYKERIFKTFVNLFKKDKSRKKFDYSELSNIIDFFIYNKEHISKSKNVHIEFIFYLACLFWNDDIKKFEFPSFISDKINNIDYTNKTYIQL